MIVIFLLWRKSHYTPQMKKSYKKNQPDATNTRPARISEDIQL